MSKLNRFLATSLIFLGQGFYSNYSYPEENKDIKEENMGLLKKIKEERGEDFRINETYVANDKNRLSYSFYSIDGRIYSSVTASERTGGFWFGLLFLGKTYNLTLSDLKDRVGDYGSVDKISFKFSDNSEGNKSTTINKDERIVNPKEEFSRDIDKVYNEILIHASKNDVERKNLSFEEMEKFYEKYFKQDENKPFSKEFYIQPSK